MQAEIRHFHLFAGLGGAARGFNAAGARVGSWEADWRCIGGVDVDPAAARDFERLTGTPCEVLDLMGRAEYELYHGEPREARNFSQLASAMELPEDGRSCRTCWPNRPELELFGEGAPDPIARMGQWVEFGGEAGIYIGPVPGGHLLRNRPGHEVVVPVEED